MPVRGWIARLLHGPNPPGSPTDHTPDREAEVPARLRREIDHTLRLAQAEYTGRQIGVYLRAYQRLARMFPEQWAEILKEEKEREERRDHDEDGT